MSGKKKRASNNKLILILAGFIVILSAGGWFYYKSFKDSVKEKNLEYLSSLGSVKGASLTAWFAKQEDLVSSILEENPFFEKKKRIWDKPVPAILQKRLTGLVGSLKASYCAIYSPDKNLLAAAGADKNIYPYELPALNEKLKQAGIFIIKRRMERTFAETVLTLPSKNNDLYNARFVMVSFSLDDKLFSELKRLPEYFASEEILLYSTASMGNEWMLDFKTNKFYDARFIEERKSTPGTIFNTPAGKISTGIDQNGKEAAAFFVKAGGFNLYIICKADLAEMNSSIKNEGTKIILFITSVMLIAVIFILFLSTGEKKKRVPAKKGKEKEIENKSETPAPADEYDASVLHNEFEVENRSIKEEMRELLPGGEIVQPAPDNFSADPAAKEIGANFEEDGPFINSNEITPVFETDEEIIEPAPIAVESLKEAAEPASEPELEAPALIPESGEITASLEETGEEVTEEEIPAAPGIEETAGKLPEQNTAAENIIPIADAVAPLPEEVIKKEEAPVMPEVVPEIIENNEIQSTVEILEIPEPEKLNEEIAEPGIEKPSELQAHESEATVADEEPAGLHEEIITAEPETLDDIITEPDEPAIELVEGKIEQTQQAFVLTEYQKPKKEIINKLDSIKGFGLIPKILYEINMQLKKEPDNPAKLASLIIKEQSLTTKLLAVANSPYYGLKKKASSIEYTLLLLGTEEVLRLITALSLSDAVRFPSTQHLRYLDYWYHSMAVGFTARDLALKMGFKEIVNDAFLGGIFHDLGIPILAKYFPNEFYKIILKIKDGENALKAELEIIGSTHQEIGRYAAEKWGLPDVIYDALACHHAPQKSESSKIMTGIINLADWMTHQITTKQSFWEQGIELEENNYKLLGFESAELRNVFLEKYYPSLHSTLGAIQF